MPGNVAPETYLRLAGERLILSGAHQRGPRQGGDLPIIGRALIASGQLDADRVRALLDEYVLAFGLRAHPGWWHFQRVSGDESPGKRLSAQRAVVCDLQFGDLDAPATLEKVVFADDATHLHVTGTRRAHQSSTPMANRRRATSHRGLGAGSPHGQVLTIKDDKGTTTSAHSGAGSATDRTWEARFSTDAPLSADTAWIEIDGERIDLPERQPPPEVRLEAVEERDQLRKMLYGEILDGQHMFHGDGETPVETAIEALVATGVLRRDDPLLVEVEAIADTFSKGRVATNLPPPWAATLRRGSKSDGPIGSVPIGAVVDSLEGVSIRFDALTSDEDSFSVALAVSPGWPLLVHFPGVRLDRSPVDFWAEDDRNNVYLLVPSGGGGSSEMAEGSIHTMAPLDPKAKELRLLPTGSRERAVVTISLAGLGAGS